MSLEQEPSDSDMLDWVLNNSIIVKPGSIWEWSESQWCYVSSPGFSITLFLNGWQLLTCSAKTRRQVVIEAMKQYENYKI